MISDIHILIAILIARIEQDATFEEPERQNIVLLINTVSPELQDAEGISVCCDDSYNRYIAVLWDNVNKNKSLAASKRRNLLYNIAKIQEKIWKH